jgi:hypothetical protein
MLLENPIIELIMADDMATVTRLEKKLRTTRKEIVDFYIEIATPPKLASWVGRKGADEERLRALKAFLLETRKAEV